MGGPATCRFSAQTFRGEPFAVVRVRYDVHQAVREGCAGSPPLLHVNLNSKVQSVLSQAFQETFPTLRNLPHNFHLPRQPVGAITATDDTALTPMSHDRFDEKAALSTHDTHDVSFEQRTSRAKRSKPQRRTACATSLLTIPTLLLRVPGVTLLRAVLVTSLAHVWRRRGARECAQNIVHYTAARVSVVEYCTDTCRQRGGAVRVGDAMQHLVNMAFSTSRTAAPPKATLFKRHRLEPWYLRSFGNKRYAVHTKTKSGHGGALPRTSRAD